MHKIRGSFFRGWMLALVLLLSACALSWGVSARADEIPFSYVHNFFLFNGMPCVDDGIDLYLYTDDEKWEKVTLDEYTLGIAASEENVYLVENSSQDEDAQEYEVIQCTLENTQVVQRKSLGFFHLDVGNEWFFPEHLLTDGERLYFLLQVDSEQWDTYAIVSIDLDTMESRILSTGKYWSLALGEHCLYTIEWDMDQAYANYTGDQNDIIMPALVSVDLATGNASALCELPGTDCGALAFDVSEQAIFIANRSKLYRIDLSNAKAEAELCAYLLPSNDRRDVPAVADHGMYMLIGRDEQMYVEQVSTDPDQTAKRVLTFNTAYLNQDIRRFATSRRDIAVVASDDIAWDTDSITKQILSGTDSADIFQVNLIDGTFAALMNKGFCVNLGENTVIREAFSQMYPQYVRMLQNDNGIFGFPAEISDTGSMLSYNTYVWEDVGLTEDEVPSSFADLLDIVGMWETDLKEENTEYSLLEFTQNLSDKLLNMLLLQAFGDCIASDVPYTLDTPAFRTCLQKLEALLPMLEEYQVEDAIFSWNWSDLPTSLLTERSVSVLPTAYYVSSTRVNQVVPMPLALSADIGPVYPMYLTVYVVNPNSPNLDLAMAFLEDVSKHMRPEMRLCLCPDYNEPVINPYYEREMQALKEEQDTLTQVLSAAEDDESREIFKGNLENLELYMEQLENERWNVSPERIAAYREIADRCIVLNDMSSLWAEETYTLSQRFLQQQMHADQFITEYQRIIRMKQLEME
ncbi:MAG: hypothetical protein IJ708_13015 [Clostridia bacterium]|nr:hypothetical protein [Clostridia bacterium]